MERGHRRRHEHVNVMRDTSRMHRVSQVVRDAAVTLVKWNQQRPVKRSRKTLLKRSLYGRPDSGTPR